jgi:hypothetical protein
MRVYLLAACCVLTACRESMPTPNNAVVVDEHTLPDGTRCAVVWTNGGTYGRAIAGGIACDWARPQAPTMSLPEGARAMIDDGRVRWVRGD